MSIGDLLGKEGSYYRLLTRKERVYGEEVGRILKNIARTIQRRWIKRLGEEPCTRILDSLQQIETFYLARHYPEALQQIVGTCELIFERQVHRYNSTQEIGLRFLRELRDQNAALGNKVYWEECLVSIYELDLICAATTV